MLRFVSWVLALAVPAVGLSLLSGCETGTPTSLSGQYRAGPKPRVSTPVVLPALQRASVHLDRADAECRKRSDAAIRKLDGFFAEAKSGVPAFAEDVLGMDSKYRLVCDYVPWVTDGHWHQRFLRRRFDDRIFSPDDLKQAIEHVLKSCLSDVADVESRMLVALRADIADLPQSQVPAFASESALREQFTAALKTVQARVARELGADVATLVTVEVATQIAMQLGEQVLAQAAMRLGISGGIIGTGAGSSWATFGAGIVVGLLVDWVVSTIYDWWCDPKGELVATMHRELDRLREAIVEGDRGLRAQLERLGKARSTQRRLAVQQLLKGGTK